MLLYIICKEGNKLSSKKVSYDSLKGLIKTDCNIKIFDELESTNITAKSEAKNGAPEGTIIIARSQTGGRGRLGRNFYSPKDSGIYLSIILRPDIPIKDIILITPTAAVAAALAIETVTNKSPKIKWVNDIFVNGKKVCGILSEAAFSENCTAAEYIILGMGINLTTPEGGFPKDIKDIAGSIYNYDELPNTNELIASIINNFLRLYGDLNNKNTKDEYQKRMLLIGNSVNYTQNGEKYSGTVLGIDEGFKLIVKNASDEIIYLESGEATIGSGNI